MSSKMEKNYMQCNKTYWEWFVTTDQKKTTNSEWPSVPDSNLENWKESAQKSAPNGNVDQLGWNTPDGIYLKALYTAADTEDLKYKNSLPGFEPFIGESSMGEPSTSSPGDRE
jgi:hypothetical protein